MTYSLMPSPHTTRETLVSIHETIALEDLFRAAGLARALGAREVASAMRFFMEPRRAQWWRMLYEGGWTAYRGAGGQWRFRRGTRKHGLPLYSALRSQRRAVA